MSDSESEEVLFGTDFPVFIPISDAQLSESTCAVIANPSIPMLKCHHDFCSRSHVVEAEVYEQYRGKPWFCYMHPDPRLAGCDAPAG